MEEMDLIADSIGLQKLTPIRGRKLITVLALYKSDGIKSSLQKLTPIRGRKLSLYISLAISKPDCLQKLTPIRGRKLIDFLNSEH